MNNHLTLVHHPHKKNVFHYLSYLLLFLLFNQPLSYTETTALKDNPVKKDSHFSNYYSFSVKVDVPSYPLYGDFRFLKIYDDLGNTLFLGQISTTHIFQIPLHILKTATQLTIEIF